MLLGSVVVSGKTCMHFLPAPIFVSGTARVSCLFARCRHAKEHETFHGDILIKNKINLELTACLLMPKDISFSPAGSKAARTTFVTLFSGRLVWSLALAGIGVLCEGVSFEWGKMFRWFPLY